MIKAAAVETNKHQRGKAVRRDRILDAARLLLKQPSDEDLSMRALAKRAEVSLATPYNLFGSKQAILLALLNQETERFVELLEREGPSDSIDRIFGYEERLYTLYATNEDYFRALMKTLDDIGDVEVRTEIRRPQIAYLKRLLRDSIASGSLSSEISIGLVSRQMYGISLYFKQEWIYGTIPLERAKLETEFGYSVLLIALASDETKGKLLARNLALEMQIE